MQEKSTRNLKGTKRALWKRTKTLPIDSVSERIERKKNIGEHRV